MDGTALIASAILLEEMVAESLEKAGDLVFCEAKGEDCGELPKFWNGMKWVDYHLPKSAEYARGKGKTLQAKDFSLFRDAYCGDQSNESVDDHDAMDIDGSSDTGQTHKRQSYAAPQELFEQLQERRRLVQTLVADLQVDNAEGLSNETQPLVAQLKSEILSTKRRQEIQSRIQHLEAQIQARKLKIMKGV
jgi:hypothetical protein